MSLSVSEGGSGHGQEVERLTPVGDELHHRIHAALAQLNRRGRSRSSGLSSTTRERGFRGPGETGLLIRQADTHPTLRSKFKSGCTRWFCSSQNCRTDRASSTMSVWEVGLTRYAFTWCR